MRKPCTYLSDMLSGCWARCRVLMCVPQGAAARIRQVAARRCAQGWYFRGETCDRWLGTRCDQPRVYVKRYGGLGLESKAIACKLSAYTRRCTAFFLVSGFHDRPRLNIPVPHAELIMAPVQTIRHKEHRKDAFSNEKSCYIHRPLSVPSCQDHLCLI